MHSYQAEFIHMAIEAEALCFGNFVLKSGRISPYFFNAGKFQRGSHIAKLGQCYAQVLIDSGLAFDMVFGPAYKGIPLAAVTVATLAEKYGRDVPYSYNRKEAKDHGEGGILVGAPLSGKVVIVDDVITAGTAVRQVLSIIDDAGAKPACIIVGLNRQERGKGDKSAIAELQETTGVSVKSIVNLTDIMHFLENTGDTATLERIASYRKEFGAE